MAAEHDLPSWLAAVHPTHCPPPGGTGVGAGVILLVAALDVRDAIGFGSSTVLVCYAVANAASG